MLAAIPSPQTEVHQAKAQIVQSYMATCVAPNGPGRPSRKEKVLSSASTRRDCGQFPSGNGRVEQAHRSAPIGLLPGVRQPESERRRRGRTRDGGTTAEDARPSKGKRTRTWPGRGECMKIKTAPHRMGGGEVSDRRAPRFCENSAFWPKLSLSALDYLPFGPVHAAHQQGSFRKRFNDLILGGVAAEQFFPFWASSWRRLNLFSFWDLFAEQGSFWPCGWFYPRFFFGHVRSPPSV